MTLDEKSLRNIKDSKHNTNGLTPIEIYIFNPFWEFVTKLLPESVAPNLLTLMGVIVPLT